MVILFVIKHRAIMTSNSAIVVIEIKTVGKHEMDESGGSWRNFWLACFDKQTMFKIVLFFFRFAVHFQTVLHNKMQTFDVNAYYRFVYVFHSFSIVC